MGIYAVKAALGVGESKFADQPLGDAVRLEPGKSGILWLGFNAFKPFNTPEANIFRLQQGCIEQRPA